MFTADMSAGHAAFVTDGVDERSPRVDYDIVVDAVDIQSDFMFRAACGHHGTLAGSAASESARGTSALTRSRR